MSQVLRCNPGRVVFIDYMDEAYYTALSVLRPDCLIARLDADHVKKISGLNFAFDGIIYETSPSDTKADLSSLRLTNRTPILIDLSRNITDIYAYKMCPVFRKLGARNIRIGAQDILIALRLILADLGVFAFLDVAKIKWGKEQIAKQVHTLLTS